MANNDGEIPDEKPAEVSKFFQIMQWECSSGSSFLQKEYSHPVYKQLAILNGKINNYPKAELIRNLKLLKLETEGSKGVLAKRLKNFYRKTMLSMHGVEKNGSGKIKVMFDYYIVIDFEATCEVVKSSSFQ